MKIKRSFRERYIYSFVFVVFVIFLSFSSLWRALGFDFWRDDWTNLWDLKFHPETSIYFDNGVTLHRYPGLAVEKVLGAQIFGSNIIDWQLLGIAFRALDALAVYFLVYGLTKSKKAGILAGLFMASTIGGLESVTWISAHSQAIFIFFVSVGIFFWIKSIDTNKLKDFLLSLLFLIIAVFSAPAGGLLIFPLAILWDLLSLIRIRKIDFFRRIVFRDVALISTVGLAINRLNFALGIFTTGDIFNSIRLAFGDIRLIKNYFSSIGNLAISWIYPINEPISLGNQTKLNLAFGLLFLTISALLFIFFLIKKGRNTQAAVFLCFWLFLFYLPNWLYERILVVGSSHRYLAVSSVAFVSLVAILFYRIRPKYLTVFSIIFILLNIVAANRLLKDISVYRSRSVVEPIWDKINSDVPFNQKDLIFVYKGSDLVWGTSMNWSGSVPFGIKRGIKNPEDLPIVTGDTQLISQLLCKKNVYRPSLGGWTYQSNRIQLSHLYVWEWNGTNLINVSDAERESYKNTVKCNVIP